MTLTNEERLDYLGINENPSPLERLTDTIWSAFMEACDGPEFDFRAGAKAAAEAILLEVQARAQCLADGFDPDEKVYVGTEVVGTAWEYYPPDHEWRCLGCSDTVFAPDPGQCLKCDGVDFAVAQAPAKPYHCNGAPEVSA